MYKFCRSLLVATLATLTLACSTSVLGLPISLTIPTPVIQATNQPASPAPPTPTQPTQTALAQGIVCFDASIAGGTLRVRECPGLGCREIGILESGAQISTTGERKDVDGATWLHIAAPFDGWVNASYLCE